MHIHGTADPRIRYNGGPGLGVATPDGGHEWPPFATQALWQFFASHPR
jgi:poly(3-hydroxybutyrate) depolymerase